MSATSALAHTPGDNAACCYFDKVTVLATFFLYVGAALPQLPQFHLEHRLGSLAYGPFRVLGTTVADPVVLQLQGGNARETAGSMNPKVTPGFKTCHSDRVIESDRANERKRFPIHTPRKV